MAKDNYGKTRCNLYIPDAIVAEVDKMAKEFGANRSVMVSVILKTYMDQQEIVKLSRIAQMGQLENKYVEQVENERQF